MERQKNIELDYYLKNGYVFTANKPYFYKHHSHRKLKELKRFQRSIRIWNRHNRLILYKVGYSSLSAAAGHAINRTSYSTQPIEDTKSIMEYIKEHRTEGDVIYLYSFSVYPFKYYAEHYGFSKDDVIEGVYGRDDRNQYTVLGHNLIASKAPERQLTSTT